MLAVGLASQEAAHGQGALPEPQAGFMWESQGVLVYSDEGSFTTDLGQATVHGVPSQLQLDEAISLTTFAPTAGANQHIVVHSSSYTVSLNGLGTVVVINMDAAERFFAGTIGFDGWVLGGQAFSLPQSDSITNAGQSQGAFGAALFGDGSSTSLSVVLTDSGVAPTTGAAIDFTFNGTYDINLTSDATVAQVFGSGSAFGSASLQTVYETFDLVPVVPEPSLVLLVLAGAGVGLRRRRR